LPFVNNDIYFQQDNPKLYMTTCSLTTTTFLMYITTCFLYNTTSILCRTTCRMRTTNKKNKHIRQLRRSIGIRSWTHSVVVFVGMVSAGQMIYQRRFRLLSILFVWGLLRFNTAWNKSERSVNISTYLFLT